MGQEKFDTLLQFFKVLGNESRLKILGLLANEERSVGELAVILGVKEPTVSHHLAMMKELGLVDVRADGNERIYWLDGRYLEETSRDIFSQNGLATLTTELETADAWEQKVLNTFVENGRIRAITTKRKKRQVVLRWLVEHFEMGVKYPEAEMNKRLTNFNPDYAALRRYLVEEGLMQRANGIYWRVEQ